MIHFFDNCAHFNCATKISEFGKSDGPGLKHLSPRFTAQRSDKSISTLASLL